MTKNWLCEHWTFHLSAEPTTVWGLFHQVLSFRKSPFHITTVKKENHEWQVFFYLWLVFKYALIMAVGTGFEPILALGEVKDTTMTGCQSVAGLTKTRESYSCSHSPLQLIYKPVHLDEYSFILFWKNTFCLRFIS